MKMHSRQFSSMREEFVKTALTQADIAERVKSVPLQHDADAVAETSRGIRSQNKAHELRAAGRTDAAAKREMLARARFNRSNQVNQRDVAGAKTVPDARMSNTAQNAATIAPGRHAPAVSGVQTNPAFAATQAAPARVAPVAVSPEAVQRVSGLASNISETPNLRGTPQRAPAAPPRPRIPAAPNRVPQELASTPTQQFMARTGARIKASPLNSRLGKAGLIGAGVVGAGALAYKGLSRTKPEPIPGTGYLKRAFAESQYSGGTTMGGQFTYRTASGMPSSAPVHPLQVTRKLAGPPPPGEEGEYGGKPSTKLANALRYAIEAVGEYQAKQATVVSPKSQLTKAQKVGLPKNTAPPGPSIADISKPKGYGKALPGTTKSSMMM